MNRAFRPAVDDLADLIGREEKLGADIHVIIEIASECAWSGSLRYTPEPNRFSKPDRSIVFFATGGGTPEEILGRLIDDFDVWKRSGGRV